MKLKKVAALCKQSRAFRLYDRISGSGEITQWLGDASAAYPLDGLPILDEESLCAVFDITEKQRENMLFRHEPLPEAIDVDDTAPHDLIIRESDLSVTYGGSGLKPLKTSNGITFIQSKYLSPLEDVIDMVQLYERTTPQGGSYIVAKTGFLIAAVIFPYSVISEKFVDEVEELARQCRRALLETRGLHSPEERAERDENQTSVFEESDGENT